MFFSNASHANMKNIFKMKEKRNTICINTGWTYFLLSLSFKFDSNFLHKVKTPVKNYLGYCVLENTK